MDKGPGSILSSISHPYAGKNEQNGCTADTWANSEGQINLRGRSSVVDMKTTHVLSCLETWTPALAPTLMAVSSIGWRSIFGKTSDQFCPVALHTMALYDWRMNIDQRVVRVLELAVRCRFQSLFGQELLNVLVFATGLSSLILDPVPCCRLLTCPPVIQHGWAPFEPCSKPLRSCEEAPWKGLA